MEDIILTTRWFFKCPECGFEEADQLITIIPSWQWHQYRERMPKTGSALFKEKIDIARTWLGLSKMAGSPSGAEPLDKLE
jgi:hypothetical protein